MFIMAYRDCLSIPHSIQAVGGAVKFRAKLTGRELPVGPATACVLAGFRRAGQARGRGQVEGVRWEQADAAAALAVESTPKAKHVVDCGQTLVSYTSRHVG